VAETKAPAEPPAPTDTAGGGEPDTGTHTGENEDVKESNG
jgi:hypothetical protein